MGQKRPEITREEAINNVAVLLRGRQIEEMLSVHDIYAGPPPASAEGDGGSAEYGRSKSDYRSKRKGR